MTKIVLGIESSCDDTGVAIVTEDKKILSNIVISQLKEHAPYNGVVPEIAARSHLMNLRLATKATFDEANLTMSDIDAIAATTGPGLIGGVIVGTMFAKAIASVTKKPFIAINHLEGHALAARLSNKIDFPYLLLLASGGHCQFVSVLGVGKYKILGQTLDDAVGEAFDKTAKILGLGYPGGPIIEKLAKNGDPNKYQLPLSMVDREGCDMSFSGLKTAVRLLIEKIKQLDDQKISDICASFQYTISEILSRRTLNAISLFNNNHKSSNFVLSGGVASNIYLRNHLANSIRNKNFNLVAPPITLCTDNAAMIAFAGVERLRLNKTNDLQTCPKARWSMEDL